MEIKYSRDLDHNYLVMKAEQDAGAADNIQERQSSNRFAERMLGMHTPEGIIGFEVRSCNRETWLFYKTDSLLSLRNRTLSSKLSRTDMHALLQALAQAQEMLGEYLLDADKLYLSLDTVFTNPSSHKWYFLSYPYSHTEEGTPESFLAEMTDVISTADDDAVSEAYTLYEMVGRKHGRMRDMLKELKQTYDVDADCSAAACLSHDYGEREENLEQIYTSQRGGYEKADDLILESRTGESGSFYEKHLESDKQRFWNKGKRLRESLEYDDANEKKIKSKYKIKTKSKSKPKPTSQKSLIQSEEDDNDDMQSDKSYLITPLLFIVVMLIPVYIRREYVLSEAASIACSVIMGLCAAGAVGSLLLERRARNAEDEESEEEEEAYGRYDEENRSWKEDDYVERLHGNREKVESKKNTGTALAERGLYDQKVNKPYNPYNRMFEKWKSDPIGDRNAEEDDNDGCTILLTGTGVKRTPKLYGRNSAVSTNIILEKLPMTLGSLGGSVDFKLSDKSVSRMHACIDKNESGDIYLKDLGSTNGTYLNGRRLASNEERCLNSGDEVRFGALEFEYI